MNRLHSALSLLEIAIIMLAGFAMSYVMAKNNLRVFALPHLSFLALAVIVRSLVCKWKLSDWGIVPGVGKQIRTGLLLWVLVQAYYSSGHIFAPFFCRGDCL